MSNESNVVATRSVAVDLETRRTQPNHLRQRLRLASESLPQLIISFACVATILTALEHGYEGPWYKLHTIMHEPNESPPAFGYRLLFPLVARELQHVAPSLTDRNCFFAVQTVIIAVTVYLSGKWASLFLPRFGKLFGYVSLTLMVTPTLTYYNFYDIAIIGFWTSCLLLLYYNKWASYTALFAIATLNHENNLLLVPVALLYAWRRMKFSRLALFAICQVGSYIVVRSVVICQVSGAALFDNRLWENLLFWRTYPLRFLILSGAILIPWWLLAFIGWRYAPSLLRCAATSLPSLFLVTTLFGKFSESRQFDAFIPTCIGFIACWFRHQSGSDDGLAVW